MKVAVTGGAGFIGSYLCEALANLGRDVTIHDNLSSELETIFENSLSQEASN